MHQQHPTAWPRLSLQKVAHAHQVGVLPVVDDLGQNDQVERAVGRLAGERYSLQIDVGQACAARCRRLQCGIADVHGQQVVAHRRQARRQHADGAPDL